MLALSLAFSCFTLTVSASVEGIEDSSSLRVVSSDEIVCSVPEDCGIASYSGDIGFNYKASSIQYYSAYLTGTLSSSSTNLTYNYTSTASSEGFANSSSKLNNGVMGYTQFSYLAPSISMPTFRYANSFVYCRFFTEAASAGATFDVGSTSVPSVSYSSYLYGKGRITNEPNYVINSREPAFATCIDTVYMTMDITVPSNSAYDLGSLNWEFDLGTSSSGNYYQVFTGSRFIRFLANVYVDGRAVASGSSYGNTNATFSLVSGYQSLSNGSVFKLLGNQSYFLTNDTPSEKTYTIGVELVPEIEYQDYSEITTVDGYGSNAFSFGRPCVAYLGTYTTALNFSRIFPGFTSPIHYTSGNLPSSGRVDDKTASALSALSSNGYYYYLYLDDLSTDDVTPGDVQSILDALNGLLDKLNSIHLTEQQILTSNQAILTTNQSIANALLTNPYTVEYFDQYSGSVVSKTVEGLDDALLKQGDAIADATNRLAYMSGSDTDIGIKDSMSDREDAIAKDFFGEDSKATFTEDDTGQLSDISGNMKDMLDTGASAGDAFDSFNEALGGSSEYSWFSSTTEQNLNPGASTYSRDNYNYDYYYSNQEEVRRRLGLDG